jgi:hypothetical protein
MYLLALQFISTTWHAVNLCVLAVLVPAFVSPKTYNAVNRLIIRYLAF